MNDIIDEVKEDLHNEAFSNIIKKYAKYVIIFIVSVVAVTSAFMYIKHRNQENQENLSKAFFAFHKNPQKEIPTALKNAEKNIYLDLAYLESANILRNKKEYSAALEKLYELLQKTKYIEIRNLAKIHAAFIIIDNKMIDESQKILKIGTVSSEEPFSEILNWSLAQLYIMNNDPEAAKNTLKTVNPKSNATQIMNEILENSIITK